jgi:hypothetical protein
LQYQNRTLAHGLYQNKLSVFETEASSKAAANITEVNEASAYISAQTWHERIGHINAKAVTTLPNAANGYIIEPKTEVRDCDACLKGKATKHINKAVTKAETYLEKVTTDICGPIQPETPSGIRYFMTFTDSATKMLKLEPLGAKSEATAKLQNMITRANTQASPNYHVKRWHADNAKEFKTKELSEFLAQKGIVATYSAPYTPEQNGQSERINRTLLNKVRTMLITARLPAEYWAEALLTAAYLYNRSPHSALKGMTPYEARYGTKPDLARIRVFRSKAYRLKPNPAKLANRAEIWTLIGYGEN